MGAPNLRLAPGAIWPRYLQAGQCVAVPDPEHPGSGQTDHVLVFLVHDDLDDGEEMADHFAGGAGQNVGVPDANRLVHSPWTANEGQNG